MCLQDAFNFKFGPDTTGSRHAATITEQSTRTLEELLEENHRSHHIFSTTENERGMYFHNHIAHHDITVWALGGTPQSLRNHHYRNALYQREPVKVQSALVQDLAVPNVFRDCLGREENFLNYTRFFQNEIDKYGYQHVLQKYLLDGSDAANDMLCRVYMGYVHGIIHIGMALEFKQAKLLAEGFAQAAVHHDWWYTDYLTAGEALSKKAEETSLPLSSCIDAAYADDTVRTSSSLSFHTQTRAVSGEMCVDLEAARDGVLANAKNELLKIAARYRVDPDNLDHATAELQNTAVYLTAGAQHPPNVCVFDFSLLHTVTSSIALSTVMAEPSLSKQQKARLLEYTGRICLLTYVAQGAPKMRVDWLRSHPSKLENQGWEEVFERATYHEDDGHMCKLIRGIAHAQRTSAPYDQRAEFKIKQDTFLTAAIAAMDSGSKKPMEITKHFDFIRGAGFEDAWNRFPVRGEVAVN